MTPSSPDKNKATSEKTPRRNNLQHSENYYLRKLFEETLVKEVMSAPAVTVAVEAHFSEVAEKVIKSRIRHLPVVDKVNHLVGLITERDLYKIKPPRKLEDGQWYYDRGELDEIILAHVMIRKPFTLHPKDTLAKVVLAMAQKKYGCIPIVDDKRSVCGIVTQVDLLRVTAAILQE